VSRALVVVSPLRQDSDDPEAPSSRCGTACFTTMRYTNPRLLYFTYIVKST